jgi:integrase
MGNKKMSGLTQRGGVWHIDKQYRGARIRESTGTCDLREAEEYLAKRLVNIREANLYGLRPDRTFRVAATRYLDDNRHLKSIGTSAVLLKQLDPYIGSLTLKQIHMGALQPFIADRQKEGVKTKTINAGLAMVRRVVNLASSEWIDEQGLTWLEVAPKIKLFAVKDARAPYPLSQEEQAILFPELPDLLARMALYKVNTGCREQEVCGLKWEYEVEVPELDTSIFLIPADNVKNSEERLVVLNRVAKSVIDAQRGQHPVYVFVLTQKDGSASPVTGMNNTAWKSARRRAAAAWKVRYGEEAPEGFRRVRVHDLKHTFGRRLRAAGVSFEDRQDLLGHKSGRITTHYSQAELESLLKAAESVCSTNPRKTSATTWLRRKAG